MSDSVERCALWASDLTRLGQPRSPSGEYVLVQVRSGRRVGRLAVAMRVDEGEVLDRLERGCRAFAWTCRDEVVSWLWVSTGKEWAPPLRRLLQFPEGDCYGWNAGTVECYRGRGLFTSLLGYAGWRMVREGCHTMWDGILDDNLASQRAHARAGMRPIVRLTVIHHPEPTRLRVRAADYADPELVRRARWVLGCDSKRTGCELLDQLSASEEECV